MPRALFLAMLLLGLPVRDAWAQANLNAEANGALQYWQAFATMPKLSDGEGQKLSAEYLTMPLDAHARELVAKSEYSLRRMHSGAARPRCDWAIQWEEEGIEALLPQMNAARLLSSLACVRARLRFEEGKTAEALDDILAAQAMGRHVSRDGSLIGVLVGYSIDARMGEAYALHLPRLNAATIRDLKKRLDALPPGARPATAIRACEEKTMDWFIRKVKATKDPERLLALLAFVGLSEGKDLTPGDKTRAFLKDCGGNAEGVIRFAEQTQPCYALMAQKIELPPEQFEKEMASEAKKQAGNPVFKEFFPAIVKVRQAQARTEVRRALLMAALDVQAEGRDALKRYPDPAGGGPFEYVAFPGGFELRSKLKQTDDKPISLPVGKRGS